MCCTVTLQLESLRPSHPINGCSLDLVLLLAKKKTYEDIRINTIDYIMTSDCVIFFEIMMSMQMQLGGNYAFKSSSYLLYYKLDTATYSKEIF